MEPPLEISSKSFPNSPERRWVQQNALRGTHPQVAQPLIGEVSRISAGDTERAAKALGIGSN